MKRINRQNNPLKVKLTCGQARDITVAASLLADLKSNIVMDDAAYDSAKLRKQIASLGGIATRYDKLANRFLAFIHLACILIWLL